MFSTVRYNSNPSHLHVPYQPLVVTDCHTDPSLDPPPPCPIQIANYVNGLVSVASYCYGSLDPSDAVLAMDPTPLAQIINLRGASGEGEQDAAALHQARRWLV